MPSYKFDDFLGVIIRSKSKPLPGQKNRSSFNYDFRQVRRGSKLRWNCPEGISFHVMEDRTAAIDPVTFKDVSNGKETSFPSESACYGLYISNPKYLSKDTSYDFEFEITVTVI